MTNKDRLIQPYVEVLNALSALRLYPGQSGGRLWDALHQMEEAMEALHDPAPLTAKTPVSREDREEAKELLRMFRLRLEFVALAESRTVVSAEQSRCIASAIRIVLEGDQ